MKSLLLVLLIVASARAEFYVAPNGSDENPGTLEKPFATLTRARDALRVKIAARLSEDVAVVVRGGTYEIREPLTFSPQDSGSDQHSITYAAYPGEKPIVSGGFQITGWKKADGHLWTVELPEVKDGKRYFRQLFVEDRRATRARIPNANAHPSCYRLKGARLSEDLSTMEVTVAPGQAVNWKNLDDLEIAILSIWDIQRKRLESVDEKTGVIRLAQPHYRTFGVLSPQAGLAFYFENAAAFLDEPGEWYLDRHTGVLAYWPFAGQDMKRANAVAAVAKSLLDIRGTSDHPVQNLHFKGISFCHTEWPLPAQGFIGRQGSLHQVKDIGQFPREQVWEFPDEAIRLEFAKGCSVTGGQIAHLGGNAVHLHKGCTGNVVEGNWISDVAATGAIVGDVETVRAYILDNQYQPPDNEVLKDNRISNNRIQNCGAVFHGGVGVWVMLTEGTVVAHNLIQDMPYGGMTVGWMWLPIPTVCKRNQIEYNHIHHAMTMLADGGAIRTMGIQPETVLRGNLIHDVNRNDETASGYVMAGIYTDDASKHITIERNVIYKTRSAFNFNLGTNAKPEEQLIFKGNTVDTAPNQSGFPKKLAAEAGPEPQFRKALQVQP